jgi:ectoine hydroxylase-related dioxygenase (phytanoyl-CoA dioxygenase family)
MCLEEPYCLSSKSIEQFRREGFIRLPDVFDKDVLGHYGEEITSITLASHQHQDVPMEERTTYQRAFIQVANLWCHSSVAREFSFSKRLARIAAELLGTSGIRIWHDQALYKEPSGGFTPWHVDQQYWPMATSQCVTAWIPLQAVSSEMGPLSFAVHSHLKQLGRDMEISDESEIAINEMAKKHGLQESSEPYELGTISFHYGWTLHRAGPNTTDQPRKVHTVIYMDQDMQLAEPVNQNQHNDWNAWTPSTKIGEVMDDPLNPILYSV